MNTPPTPESYDLIMGHAAMLIIFSRRVLIIAEPRSPVDITMNK
jgi:hypothetical protein